MAGGGGGRGREIAHAMRACSCTVAHASQTLSHPLLTPSPLPQLVTADAYVAALDVPGAHRLIPQAWRPTSPFWDNIFKLVGVPVITVQLRYDGWVTEMRDAAAARRLGQGAEGLDNLLYRCVCVGGGGACWCWGGRCVDAEVWRRRVCGTGPRPPRRRLCLPSEPHRPTHPPTTPTPTHPPPTRAAPTPTLAALPTWRSPPPWTTTARGAAA